MNKPLIVKDSREQLGYDFPEDDIFGGTIIEKLEYGDYSIFGYENLIFLDRKQNTSELANNFVEDRFERLLENTKYLKYRFLLLEFDWEDILTYPINSGIPQRFFKKIKIKPAFLISYLSKISINYGIHVMYAGNAERAEKLCYSILKQIYKTETKCLK